MRLLRRRFAACALALVVCQAALVFAAPLSSCCPSKPHAAAAQQQDEECCPAGSHPPGQCPRHARSLPRPATSCRMQCDAPHGAQFVIGAAAMLPAPAAAIAAAAFSSTVVPAGLAPDTRPFVPESPPPRLV